MLLEVNNQTVAGLTLYDLNTIISRAEDPVRLKSVREGNQIMKELRRYLSMKTEKGISKSYSKLGRIGFRLWIPDSNKRLYNCRIC